MKDFTIIRTLLGDTVTEEELKHVDCYVHQKLGLFIPCTGPCLYARRPSHTHPSYMFAIVFASESDELKPIQERSMTHYRGVAVSPGKEHTDLEDPGTHYYCILIDKEYFESQYRMYTTEKPDFVWKEFEICQDILKTLNTFAFEYSKKMQNADITLEAQSTIITHWLIRSLLGENYDMRAISSHYGVARAEHFMEQHYGENITVRQMADLVSMSVSSFQRVFKKETGLTPIEYLIEIRIQKAKKLLRRRDIPVTEIAMRCGFGSSSHFSSSFSRLQNVTPTEYQEAYGK